MCLSLYYCKRNHDTGEISSAGQSLKKKKNNNDDQAGAALLLVDWTIGIGAVQCRS